MKFDKLVKEFEKAGHYLQDLGDGNYLNRYRFTSMYEDDEGFQITKNHTHTLEDLERILKLLTVKKLGKYEVQAVKLILNEDPVEDFSKLMTKMEIEFNIPLLNNPEWNEKNKDIIHLYKLISNHRELKNTTETKIKKKLVTVYFNNKEDSKLEERYYDRFIIETVERSFFGKLFDICEIKKYAYPDFRKIREGYESVERIEIYNLTDLEVFTDDYFAEKELEQIEDDWNMEI